MTTPGISATPAKEHIDLHVITDLDDWLASRGADVTQWVNQQDFKAKPGAHLSIPALNGKPAAVIVGASESPCLTTLGGLPLRLPQGSYVPSTPLAELDALGWALGAYQYSTYKDATRAPATLVLQDNDLRTAVERLADATALTRDLINAPANDMLPTHLEAATRALASAFKADVNVTTGDELLEAGYNTPPAACAP